MLKQNASSSNSYVLTLSSNERKDLPHTTHIFEKYRVLSCPTYR